MNHQDLYKFTMSNAFSFFRGNHTSRWALGNRGREKIGVLADGLKTALNVKDNKATVPLSLTGEDKEYLHKTLGFGTQQCLKWADIGNNKAEVLINPLEDGNLSFEVHGQIGEATFFEIPSLGEIQEQWSFYNGWADDRNVLSEGRKRLEAKVKLYNTLPKGECFFVEMGTRRAFTKAWHREVTEYLADNLVNFSGTSNVGVAKDLGVNCIGTQAHEWFQAGQVLSPSLKTVNGFMLRVWHDVYGSTLGMKYGIALTDCLTTDVFLKEFDPFLSNVYSGCRHDSGSPFVWADKLIAHYNKHGIDPRGKTVVFSNSLNPEMVFKIFNYCRGKFGKIIFGIGTDFCHDLGVKGLNIVFKMIEFDGLPVAKISDEMGKGMCRDKAYEDYVKLLNGIKNG